MIQRIVDIYKLSNIECLPMYEKHVLDYNAYNGKRNDIYRLGHRKDIFLYNFNGLAHETCNKFDTYTIIPITQYLRFIVESSFWKNNIMIK